MKRIKTLEQQKTNQTENTKLQDLLIMYYVDSYGFIQRVCGNSLEEIYQKILQDKE